MSPQIKEVMDKYNTFQVFQLSKNMLPELVDSFRCKNGIIQYKGNEIIDSYLKNYNNRNKLNVTLQDLIEENKTTRTMTYVSRNLKVMNIFIDQIGIYEPIILGDKQNTQHDYQNYTCDLEDTIYQGFKKFYNEEISDSDYTLYMDIIKSSLDLYVIIFDYYCSNFKIVKTNSSLCYSFFSDTVEKYDTVRGKEAKTVRTFFLKAICERKILSDQPIVESVLDDLVKQVMSPEGIKITDEEKKRLEQYYIYIETMDL